MRVFLDTNVIVSAMLFGGGVAARSYEMAVVHHHALVSVMC